MELPKNLAGYFERAVLDVCAMQIPFLQIINVKANFDITVDNSQKIVLDIEENVKHNMKIYNRGSMNWEESKAGTSPAPVQMKRPAMGGGMPPPKRGRGGSSGPSRGAPSGRGRGAAKGTASRNPMGMMMQNGPRPQMGNRMPMGNQQMRGQPPPLSHPPMPQGQMVQGNRQMFNTGARMQTPPGTPKGPDSRGNFPSKTSALSNSDLLNSVLSQVLGKLPDNQNNAASSSTHSQPRHPPSPQHQPQNNGLHHNPSSSGNSSAISHGQAPLTSMAQRLPPVASPMSSPQQSMPVGSPLLPPHQQQQQQHTHQQVPASTLGMPILDNSAVASSPIRPQHDGPPTLSAPGTPRQDISTMLSTADVPGPSTPKDNAPPQQTLPSISTITSPLAPPPRPSSAASNSSGGSTGSNLKPQNWDPVVKLTKLPDEILGLAHKAQEQRNMQMANSLMDTGQSSRPRFEPPPELTNEGRQPRAELPLEILQIVNKAKMERNQTMAAGDAPIPPGGQPPTSPNQPQSSTNAGHFLVDSLANMLGEGIENSANSTKIQEKDTDQSETVDESEETIDLTDDTENDEHQTGITTQLSFSSDLSDLDSIRPSKFDWSLADISHEDIGDTDDLGELTPKKKDSSEPDNFSNEQKSQVVTAFKAGSLLCSFCSTDFEKPMEFENHMLTVHSLHGCLICGKNYTKISELQQHKKMEHSGIPCPKCRKILSSEASLKIHLLKHQAERKVAKADKPFSCEQCGKGLSSKNALQMHVKLKHSPVQTTFKCDVCQKPFKTEGSLKTHKVLHTNYRPYKCEKCQSGFVAKAHYLSHSKNCDGSSNQITPRVDESGIVQDQNSVLENL